MENIELLKIENEILKSRLKHLYKSKTIRIFDSKDYKTHNYSLDINLLDTIVSSYLKTIIPILEELNLIKK